MDPYALAAIEAQAWQDEAARNDKALAAKLRAIADGMEGRIDLWLEQDRPITKMELTGWIAEIRKIADGLTARF